MTQTELLKQLPPVHELLEDETGKELCRKYNRDRVRDCINAHLDLLRTELQTSDGEVSDLRERISSNHILKRVKQDLEKRSSPSVTRVINGTGVILHTGLGRAVLGEEVIDHLSEVNAGYSLLAVDRENKERIRRERGAAALIQELTGAEAATVVNNNAAAVFLVLSAFARDREVIISRGELVEIGGSFRVPEVMAQSGAHLVEVGTTNKTHPSDYEEAIGEETAMLMKVHTSNYRVVGFQKEVGMEKLSGIAENHDLLAVEDLGSGALVDMSSYGLSREPVARDAIENGADLICFSCDKLLGGPQGGVIAGKESLVDQVRNHPLFRAVRTDKLLLTALEKTLEAYLKANKLEQKIPALRMLSLPVDTLEERAETLSKKVNQLDEYTARVEAGKSEVGGGSLPGEHLPTFLVGINSNSRSAGELSLQLRRQDPPVFGRVQDEEFFLDTRTLLEGDREQILEALASLSSSEPVADT